jgi:hypothetical protein
MDMEGEREERAYLASACRHTRTQHPLGKGTHILASKAWGKIYWKISTLSHYPLHAEHEFVIKSLIFAGRARRARVHRQRSSLKFRRGLAL